MPSISNNKNTIHYTKLASMKTSFILFFILLSFTLQAQLLNDKDTLTINYYMATAGEFGGVSEGIDIYWDNRCLVATHRQYDNEYIHDVLGAHNELAKQNGKPTKTLSGDEFKKNALQRDSIKQKVLVRFYKNNRDSCKILKKALPLSDEQIKYIGKFLTELIALRIDREVFSNAAEHYVLFHANDSYVYLDNAGSWKGYLELRKVLGLDNTKPNYKAVFNKVVKKNSNLSKTAAKREKYEHYWENHLHPTLDMLKSEMSTNYDPEVMHSFLNMILKTQNSADEYPNHCLATIFIKKPIEVKKSILKFKKYNNLLTLLKALEFGYLNIKPTNAAQSDSVMRELKNKLQQK